MLRQSVSLIVVAFALSACIGGGTPGKAEVQKGLENLAKEAPMLFGSDKPVVSAEDLPAELRSLDPVFRALPAGAQAMQLWAQQLPGVYDAENSETQWSDEYFAKWLAEPQTKSLGSIPVIVLSRSDGGYKDGEADVPASQLDTERRDGQAKLVSLSSNAKQVIVRSGHNMNLEAPDEVCKAIIEVVQAVRHHRAL